MSKTFKFNVAFALSVGACSDVVAEMSHARKEIIKSVEKDGLEAHLKKATGGHRLVKLAIDPTVPEDEFLQALVVTGMRESLKMMHSDDKEGNFQRFGDISIKPRDPKVPTTSINCIHCRVLDGAGRPYKCATCRNVDEVK